jgi:hypothetical protein
MSTLLRKFRFVSALLSSRQPEYLSLAPLDKVFHYGGTDVILNP